MVNRLACDLMFEICFTQLL